MPMGKREIQINSSVDNARGSDISLWQEGTEREIKFQIFLKGKEKITSNFYHATFAGKPRNILLPRTKYTALSAEHSNKNK